MASQERLLYFQLRQHNGSASYVAEDDATCSGRNPIPMMRAGMRRKTGIWRNNLSGNGSD